MQIDDASLNLARASLTAAAALTNSPRRRRPEVTLPSLTGIGHDVDQYLQGLQVAQMALSRAASSACDAVTAMMNDSDALDRKAAGASSGLCVATGSGR